MSIGQSVIIKFVEQQLKNHLITISMMKLQQAFVIYNKVLTKLSFKIINCQHRMNDSYFLKSLYVVIQQLKCHVNAQ